MGGSSPAAAWRGATAGLRRRRVDGFRRSMARGRQGEDARALGGTGGVAAAGRFRVLVFGPMGQGGLRRWLARRRRLTGAGMPERRPRSRSGVCGGRPADPWRGTCMEATDLASGPDLVVSVATTAATAWGRLVGAWLLRPAPADTW
jgi:hypothetical protein